MWGRVSPAERTTPTKRKPGRPLEPINHGTTAGYLKHLRRGQRTCASCRRAWRTYNGQRRAHQREERRLRRIRGVSQVAPEEVIRRLLAGEYDTPESEAAM